MTDQSEPYDPNRPINHATLAVAQRLAALTPFARGYLLALLSDHFEAANVDTASRLAESAFNAIEDIAESAPRDIVAILVAAQQTHTRRVSLIEAGADYYLSGPAVMLDQGDDGLYRLGVLTERHPNAPHSQEALPISTSDAADCGRDVGQYHASADHHAGSSECASRRLCDHDQPTRKVSDDRLQRPEGDNRPSDHNRACVASD